MIGYQKPMDARAEPIQPTGLAQQIDRFERLLSVQDEMLQTLNNRLSFVLRPMNAVAPPVGSTNAPVPSSAATDHLRILLSQLESHNERLIALIEGADV